MAHVVHQVKLSSLCICDPVVVKANDSHSVLLEVNEVCIGTIY